MKTGAKTSVDRSTPLARFFLNRYLILDTVLIGLLIGVPSWMFRRADPAWYDFNPSPWLLVPLLIGFRYGFWKGISAGIVAGVVTALLVCLPNVENIPGLIAENAVHYASYLGVGGFAGFARHLILDRVPDLERENELLKNELSRNHAALALFRENEILLKQSLLLHNAEFVSLSDELEKLLLIKDDQSALENLMGLMESRFSILAGGLYIEKQTGRLDRIAATSGSEGEMPGSIKSKDSMVALAMKSKRLVTCRDLWDVASVKSNSPFLAVIPVGGGKAYLAIRRMKLSAITWDNFGRLEALLTYWMCNRDAQGQVVDKRDFDRALENAITLRDDFGVPGYVVQFKGSKNVTETVSQMAFSGYYSEMGAQLCVIVMEGKNGAAAFGEKIKDKIKGVTVQYEVLSLESALSATRG